ncbi:hypothetical protein IQ05_01295 [Flavobacterium tiangeerense]|uniref:Uncharacterized protein n=1 Tax=Flavobacterium tiangeerense TaxID=459471 RepID=A0ABY3FLH2_9FLAO|nr:hypothetical protein [Flavobacterium tiangeerense]TWI00638.1 hypothetical protein IQ05_01295 [Flavobacterium tiangeerense]
MEQKPIKPKQLITKEFAKLLNENYNKTRYPLIKEAIKKEDANAIWFSIVELENYIAYIKAEAKRQKGEIDGIRFHFGAYPEDKAYAEKAGLTTIFLAPTGTKKIKKTTEVSKMEKSIENDDSLNIAPLNYGSIGNPPPIPYIY